MWLKKGKWVTKCSTSETLNSNKSDNFVWLKKGKRVDETKCSTIET